MPESFYAKITPMAGPEGPVDPGFGQPGTGGPVDPGFGRPGWSPVDPGYGKPGGGHPSHPIVLPPLPGVWPSPGVPAHPIVIPPDVAFPAHPSHPIYIEGTPEHPITLPPGEVYPPLPPETAGKVIAVIVLGEGKVHWYHVPPVSVSPKPPIPPGPTPK